MGKKLLPQKGKYISNIEESTMEHVNKYIKKKKQKICAQTVFFFFVLTRQTYERKRSQKKKLPSIQFDKPKISETSSTSTYSL